MNKKQIVAIIAILLLAGTTAALTYNSLSSIKMHIAGTTITESSVIVDSIDIIGSKKVNKVNVVLNNTDANPHTVNICASLEDISGAEIGVGTSTSVTIPASSTQSESIALMTKPDLAYVVNVVVTLKEI